MHSPPKLVDKDRPIDWLLMPFDAFFRQEASGGILLLGCTIIALAWANSPWGQTYHDFWHTNLSVTIGSYALSESLAHWVNDGLMAIFFFVVGLEIKRELLVGELASPRQAAVPMLAAVGGMAVPALVYVLFNYGTPAVSAWAIPAATDIAFALGVVALLGKRVPTSLKIFLTALAIVDDIGAVLIIAIFYTSDISAAYLVAGAAILSLLVLTNLLGVRRPLVYAVLGIALWFAFLRSGVHATVAGVLLAFTIPSRVRIDGATFVSFAKKAIGDFERRGGDENDIVTNACRQSAVHGLEEACEHIQTPLLRMEHGLHPLMSHAVMPIFALANAGVVLGDGIGTALTSSVCLGVMFGLIIGKQIGVTAFTALAVKSGIGKLSSGTTWRQIYGTSWLAGIGFTMSLFIANIAFEEDLQSLQYAKVGILAGSLVSGTVGFVVLRLSFRQPQGKLHGNSASR